MAFENYPWHNLTQPAKGFCVFCVTSLLTVFIYFFFMHAHYHVLFYPWQKFAAAFPWWIVVMLYHNWFMDGWPGRKIAGGKNITDK